MITKITSRIDFLPALQVEGILAVLTTYDSLSNNKLIQLTGLPKETLKNVKSLLNDILEKTDENSIKISKQAKALLLKENPKQYKWTLLEYQDPEVLEKFVKIREHYKKTAKRDLDQFFATPQTSIAKASVLIDKIGNKKVAQIGDDDFVSLALLLKNFDPKNISVFEIDQDLIEYIKAKQLELNENPIQIIKYDARKEIPENYRGRYDAVMTDPPYTKAGITLFLNRALELLGPATADKPKYIFLFYGNSFRSPEKTLKIQEIINRMNLLIEDRVDKFARYNGAESIGSQSALYVLKVIPQTTTIKDTNLSNIYTYNERGDEKFPFVDHITAKIFKIPATIIKSKSALNRAIGDFCRYHKLKVVDQKITTFKNGGTTLTFVLANSNLTIHTWPEYQAIHIDLITCSPIYAKDQIGVNLAKLFSTDLIEVREIE